MRNNLFDVWAMILFGIVGVLFRDWHYPIAPLVIGVILGPMTENNLRKMLMGFRGNVAMILDRPIALAFLAVAVAIIAFKIVNYLITRTAGSEKHGKLPLTEE